MDEKLVHSKKKNSNKRKKDNEKTPHEDQKKKFYRPNFFVGIPVSNPKIHKEVMKVQEQLLASQPALEHCLVDVACLHVTLFVMSLQPNEVPLACSCLDRFAAQHSNRFSVPPITLNIRGVGHFRNQVVFADVSSDEGLHRLRALRQAALESFTSGSVAVKDDAKEEEQWRPHLTVAKLSKFRGAKKMKDKLRRIEPSCYANLVDHDFGEALVTKVLLSAMTEPKDANRYYRCERCCQLDVESSEADDHSECCFPRHPAVHSSRTASEAVNATSSEVPTDSPRKDATCANGTTSFDANVISVSLDDFAHITSSDKSTVLIDATLPSNVHVTATTDTEADDLDSSTSTDGRDTVSDTIGRHTVSDTVGRNTASYTVGRHTVSDTVERDTASYTVGRHTVGRDTASYTVGSNTVSDANADDTVLDANARNTVSDTNGRDTVLDANADDTVLDANALNTVSDTNGRDTVSDANADDTVLDANAPNTVSDTSGRDTVSDANARGSVSDKTV